MQLEAICSWPQIRSPTWYDYIRMRGYIYIDHQNIRNIAVKRDVWKVEKKEATTIYVWVQITWRLSHSMYFKEFVIPKKPWYGPGFPIDSRQLNASGKNVFRDLTSDRSRCSLFDLCQLQIQQFIKKCQEFLSADKVRFVHHPHDIICCSGHFEIV